MTVSINIHAENSVDALEQLAALAAALTGAAGALAPKAAVPKASDTVVAPAPVAEPSQASDVAEASQAATDEAPLTRTAGLGARISTLRPRA